MRTRIVQRRVERSGAKRLRHGLGELLGGGRLIGDEGLDRDAGGRKRRLRFGLAVAAGDMEHARAAPKRGDDARREPRRVRFRGDIAEPGGADEGGGALADGVDGERFRKPGQRRHAVRARHDKRCK